MIRRSSYDSGSSWGYIGILITLLVIFFLVNMCASSNKYNNGICSLCGGKYEFKETVGHEYFTNYVYVCNKCGHLIEISYYAQPNKNTE